MRAHHDADDPGHGGRVQLGGHEAGQVAAACLLLGRELEGGRTDVKIVRTMKRIACAESV